MKYRIVALLLNWICSSVFISAQNPDYSVINLNNDKNLSNGSVTCLVQDHLGFIWVGTKQGLNWYDGHIFRTVDLGLETVDISALLADKTGNLWIGTVGDGLAYFDQKNHVTIKYSPPESFGVNLESQVITDLFEDSTGSLWIGTENGLFVIDSANNFTHFYEVDPTGRHKDHHIQSIVESQDNKVWVGTFGDGLYLADRNTQELKKVEVLNNQEKTNFILIVFEVNPRILLIGTNNNGLLKLDTSSGIISDFFQETVETPTPSIVRDLYLDSSNNLWIGTDGDGLYLVNHLNEDQQVLEIKKENPYGWNLSDNAINTIFEDDQNNIWAGTAWNGISIFQPDDKEVTQYSTELPGKESSPVLSISTHLESLWLGSNGNGLTQINNQTHQILKHTQFDGQYIQVIQPQEDQRVFISTYANGFYIYDPLSKLSKQYQNIIGQKNSLSFNDVRGAIQDTDSDSIWLGTWGGGLNFLNPSDGLCRTFRHSESDLSTISSNNITGMFKSRSGQIWITTYGGGLNLFDQKKFKFQHFKESMDSLGLSSNNLLTALEDSQGELWLGTWEKGPNKLNISTGHVEKFQNVKFIQERTITAILEDDSTNLWFSSKKGIFCYHRNTGKFISYPQLNGEYHINAAHKDDQGYLYFGSKTGTIKFLPENLRTLKPPTGKTLITDLKLFNESVPIHSGGILNKHVSFTDEIILAHHENIITFEYATLKYPSSSDYEFSIKMDGFDKDWREQGKQRSTTFTNLPSGKYTFKVRSKSLGGDWNHEEAKIGIIVLKPWWQRSWAIILYFILFIFFLWVFRRSIVSWEKMKNQLQLKEAIHQKDKELHLTKQRFFNNISHEIRTPITLILASVNRLTEDVPNQKNLTSHVQALRKNGNYLLNLVNELLEYRKLESGQTELNVSKINFVDYINEIFIAFKSKTNNRQIDYTFSVDDEQSLIHLWIDTIQMEKVFFNIIDNAIKFVPNAGKVAVELSTDDQFCYVNIKDTGNGIPKDRLESIFDRFYQTDHHSCEKTRGFGIGLSIVKEIVQMHQGQIHVESENGIGTKFTIKLLLGNNHFHPSELNNSNQINYDESQPEGIGDQTDLSEQYEFTKEKSILIVEDNEDLKNYLVSALKNRFSTITASNGIEGTQLATSEIPDLIISDVMMPEKDGIDLLHDLKTDVRTSHIPVILLTARTGLVYKKVGLDTGADDYITKPFNEALLLSRINNLIKSRQALWQRFRVQTITEPQQLALNTVDEEFLKNLTRLIEENITLNDLNPEFLSNEMAMSHSVIYKKLKQLTGKSIVEFIRDFKLKRGAELIKKYNYSIQDACYTAGFSDRRYFTRAFKNKFGKTPSEYAKSLN